MLRDLDMNEMNAVSGGIDQVVSHGTIIRGGTSTTNWLAVSAVYGDASIMLSDFDLGGGGGGGGGVTPTPTPEPEPTPTEDDNGITAEWGDGSIDITCCSIPIGPASIGIDVGSISIDTSGLPTNPPNIMTGTPYERL